MIKENIETIKKGNINYITENRKVIRFKPWLSNIFSFLYDLAMVKSVFPKKLEASFGDHIRFLEDKYSGIHGKKVLELAAGSGHLAEILPSDNKYIGVDISEGLLKIADKKFTKAGFEDFNLFLCSANDLPFSDDYFDVCVCNLSLNFFDDVKSVMYEVKRVLKGQGKFLCSVPVPERKKGGNNIRGKLYSENELKNMFEETGFKFSSYEFKNGSLLYFEGEYEKKNK